MLAAKGNSAEMQLLRSPPWRCKLLSLIGLQATHTEPNSPRRRMTTAVCFGITIASSYTRKAFLVPRESISLDSPPFPARTPTATPSPAVHILEDCMIRSLRYFKSDGSFLVLL